jgi:hypothetical protein
MIRRFLSSITCSGDCLRSVSFGIAFQTLPRSQAAKEAVQLSQEVITCCALYRPLRRQLLVRPQYFFYNDVEIWTALTEAMEIFLRVK